MKLIDIQITPEGNLPLKKENDRKMRIGISQNDERPRIRKRLPPRWAPTVPNRFFAWSPAPAALSQKRGSWG
jgi:hypothetical protein